MLPLSTHTPARPSACSYWGEALVSGMGNKKESAEECCAACRSYQPLKERDMMTCNGGRSSRHIATPLVCRAVARNSWRRPAVPRLYCVRAARGDMAADRFPGGRER